ncbi:MAG: PDZ domain-containing protein [Acidobacteriaceae bacterium]
MKQSSFSWSIACLALLALPVAAGPYAMAAPLGISSLHRHNGYLGVDFENLTKQQKARLHVAPDEGVAIAAVDHDAPAGKAGLRSEDVIVRLNGKKVQHAEALIDALHEMDPGQTVVLDIVRNQKSMEVHVVLADRRTVAQEAWSQRYTAPDPEEEAQAQTGFFGAVPSEIDKTFSSNGGLMSYVPGTAPYTGIEVDVLNPQLAHYFGLKNVPGLLVKRIDPNSPGIHAGVEAGDVICSANDVPMISRSKWNHALRENRHAAIKLKIIRNKRTQILILTLAANKS